MSKTGWFADRDDEEAPGMWRPYLQLDGLVVDLGVWCQTKEECEEWIRTEVIGKGML